MICTLLVFPTSRFNNESCEPLRVIRVATTPASRLIGVLGVATIPGSRNESCESLRFLGVATIPGSRYESWESLGVLGVATGPGSRSNNLITSMNNKEKSPCIMKLSKINKISYFSL